MRSTFARVAMLMLVLVCVGAWPMTSAEGQKSDPAARGLDLYIHAPSSAAPGGAFELAVEAFGFPTVTRAVPLAGATIEAGWDPEKLDGQPAPKAVTVTTDAGGRARVVVPVPDGVPADLSLLVDLRHGDHVRSHALNVRRASDSTVELHVADHRVVPTSTISAWVRVVGVAGQPLGGTPIVVELEEGGVARHREKLVTDKGGLAMARVPIPRIDEPVWSWTLSAHVDRPSAQATKIGLVPREENPGTPTLAAGFDAARAGGLRPGEKSKFSIRVLDATRSPVADQRVTYWLGAKGVEAPKDDNEWKKLAIVATTDGAGTVSGSYTAPTLVRHGGTSARLLVRTELEGHELRVEGDVAIGMAQPALTVTPEVTALVPGIPQELAITMLDGKGNGVEGTFDVTADGLSARVTTNADGEGGVKWNVPKVVGASRNTGPCAGGVAAAVTVRPVGNIPALAGERDAFVTCVSVDRDAEGIVRVEPTIARAGEKVRVTLTRGRAGKRGASVLAASARHPQAMAAWLDGRDDGSAVGELTLPADAGSGVWTLSLAGPDGARAASVASTSLFVVPTTLPLLEVKRVGGRAAPGGKVEIEGRLTDGHGRPLQGSISAVVVDAFGGGNANVSGLDTRTMLCAQLGHPSSCELVLERDPSTEAFRKTIGSRFGGGAIGPLNDPGAHASEDLTKTFGEVLRSLEGAVFEAANTPQTLLDVSRRDKATGLWSFNPELMTLATEAMSEPPMTPGGEKLTLSDLFAVDPQVTFDNVARRLSRLKLFRVLAAIRQERNARNLDPDEPVFKDPNALVRRLVRKGSLTEDALLDPWGGTIQFVKSTANAAPVPFINVIRGWELHAPGPDGIVGTGDDVRDPFERVVRSGTPYAKATDEDKLVDARWDMVVSEETVNSWSTVLEEVTGTKLGGLGISGMGAGGGGGAGGGIGIGNVGTIGHGSGAGRASSGISSGDAYWVAPIRTDAEGRVHLSIPLGDVETTWQIALIGVADGAGPASATLDLPSDLPLSARVAGGARWVEGDVVDTDIIVRNRANVAARARVGVKAEGAAAVEGPSEKSVDVPAHGARSVHVRVKAQRSGEGILVVTTRADGMPEDVLRHAWEIVPPGEMRVLTKTSWVEGRKELVLALDHGYRLAGTPKVVLERGYDDSVAAALDSLEPERQTSTAALADAYEASVRIERWALSRPNPRHKALAGIAHRMGERSLGRFTAFAALDTKTKTTRFQQTSEVLDRRVRQLTRTPSSMRGEAALCPPADAGSEALELEPAPTPDVLPCWGAYVSDATYAVEHSGDPERIALAILSLAEREHRAALATSLVEQLRTMVHLHSGGEMLGASGLNDRASRAIVYAALLRAQRFGHSPASADALFSRIAVLRDVTGGYGSSRATLAVLRALLSSQLEGKGTTRARVMGRTIDVPESGDVSVPIPEGALSVWVETEGPGIIARFERPVLRLWSRPPPPASSPVSLDVVWPSDVRAGATALLRLVVRHGRDEVLDVDTRVPLPPGATLAAPTEGAAQLQGVLAVRRTVSSTGAVIEVPMRFALSGTMTAPEANARLTRAPTAPAVAPARAISIRAR